MESTLAISVSGVSKSYGSLNALSEVSFSVRRGEIFAYLGPNGAGKTTTICSENRAKYGIVGSAVNLASRIQNQAQGGEVVISSSIYRRVASEVVVKRDFQANLKGIQEPMMLYAIS
jgi:ABC-type branched-subunit amino acid transport system ATPase component